MPEVTSSQDCLEKENSNGIDPKTTELVQNMKTDPPPKNIGKGTGNFNRQKGHLRKFSVLTKISKPHRRELAVPEDSCKYPDSAS